MAERLPSDAGGDIILVQLTRKDGMIRFLALAIALGCAPTPGACIPQDDVAAPYSFTVKDVPGDAKTGKKPVLLIEGASQLPVRARLKFIVYYDLVSPDRELFTKDILTEGEKFSVEADIFPERENNLAGVWPVRVTFNPNVQPPDVHANLKPEWRRHFSVFHRLRIGDMSRILREQNEVRERFTGILRRTETLMTEIEADRARREGTPFVEKEWAELTTAWVRRYMEQVEKQVGGKKEFYALGFYFTANTGVETLRNNLRAFIYANGDLLRDPKNPDGRVAIEVSRTAVVRLLEDYTRSTQKKLTPDEMIQIIEETRTLLAGAVTLAGEPLAGARRRFRALILHLDTAIPKLLHGALQAVATEGIRFFAVIDGDKEEAGRILPKLDRQLQDLVPAIRADKKTP